MCFLYLRPPFQFLWLAEHLLADPAPSSLFSDRPSQLSCAPPAALLPLQSRAGHGGDSLRPRAARWGRLRATGNGLPGYDRRLRGYDVFGGMVGLMLSD